ncbi:MAG: hypothetical protein FWG15_07225 [Propionibacteriaceae bacterium]|nr:hypothetical protein [Propionibacteriaceae bacterium]
MTPPVASPHPWAIVPHQIHAPGPPIPHDQRGSSPGGVSTPLVGGPPPAAISTPPTVVNPAPVTTTVVPQPSYPVGPINSAPGYLAPTKTKSKTPLIVGILFSALIVALIVYAGFMIANPGEVPTTQPTDFTSQTTEKDFEEADFYDVGQDKIPSVKHVLGSPRTVTDADVMDWGHGTIYIDLQFQALGGTDPREDMKNYIHYLVDEEGFELTQYPNSQNNYGITILWRLSESTRSLLEVEVQFTDSTFSLYLSGYSDYEISETGSDEETSGSFSDIDYVLPPGWVNIKHLSLQAYRHGSARIAITNTYTSGPDKAAYMEERRAALIDNQVATDLGPVSTVSVAKQDGWRFTYSDIRKNEEVIVVAFFKDYIEYDIQCSAPRGDPQLLTKVTQDCQAVIDSVIFK